MVSRQTPGIELMPCPFWRRFNSIYRRGFLLQKNESWKFLWASENVCLCPFSFSHFFRSAVWLPFAKLLGPGLNWLWLWGPGGGQ